MARLVLSARLKSQCFNFKARLAIANLCDKKQNTNGRGKINNSKKKTYNSWCMPVI
jgi:hypothetical protein